MRAGALLDEASVLQDDLAVAADRLAWRRKDVERATARGRASVRNAFERVRAQLADREAELLESLDAYEADTLSRLDVGIGSHDTLMSDLRDVQDTIRARCRGGEAVDALNSYARAKQTIALVREGFASQEDVSLHAQPDQFVGIAGTARQELSLHAEGLATLEDAVRHLCTAGGLSPKNDSTPSQQWGRRRGQGMDNSTTVSSGWPSEAGGASSPGFP